MRGPIYGATHRDPVEDRASTAVLRAVASAEDVDPVELDARLHEAVDPESLDSLFRAGTDGLIQFPYCGYDVSVHDDGRVTLEEAR